MKVQFTRVLRTPSSERYLIHIDGTGDDAALDLHYVDDGSVAGTLIVLDKQYATKELTARLVEEIDRILLPSVSVGEGSLSFTIVKGTVLGTFTGQADEE